MRSIRVFIIALLSVALVWALGFVLFSAQILMDKPISPEKKTQAIVVFTGADNRIEQGLTMFAMKRADKIFVSGVYKYLDQGSFMKAWRKRIPLPIPCCVTLGYMAENTIGNASEVKGWIKSHDIQSVRLVTSDYHMPRAYLELSRVLSGVTIYKHPVSSEGVRNPSSRFWQHVFTEYHKLIARWLHFNELKAT